MTELDPIELKQLARDVAASVAGLEANDVMIRSGEDSTGSPVYFFWYLYNQEEVRNKVGRLRTRLSQQLYDELHSRHDEHYPYVQVLNRADWDILRARSS